MLFRSVADGVVTDKKNIVLCIGTADCIPLLFCDEKKQIIGAAHAGWRGAMKGIAENTLQLMLDLGSQKSDIKVAIGPCLQKQSFEAGLDMKKEFLNLNQNYEKYFTEGKDNQHFMFDIFFFFQMDLPY